MTLHSFDRNSHRAHTVAATPAVSNVSRRSGAVRRLLVLAAIATAGVTTLAVPTAAHAAPVAPIAAQNRPQKPTRLPDVIADQASQALAMVKRFEQTGDRLALSGFDRARDDIAAAVAARLGLEASAMQDAWRAADLEHQTAVIAAMGQLGVSYRRNTSRPGVGFDCSGLTTYAWAQAGHELTRQSTAQIRAAAPRNRSTAQAGDLVQYPGHVMMWLGVDLAVVHAVMPGRPVEVDNVRDRSSLRWGDPTG